jgi:alkanesulfonate monooxygenase SsuD/methylene tetrahydromethanopterin reductase-like flavin-dependent oxidoreductase (luciferase family)
MDFSKRGRQLDETLEVVRDLWRGGMVEHHGELFDFGRLQMSPVPPAPIPIYIGGASPPAMRRAARFDGWLSAGNAPEDIPGIVETLRGHRKDAGASGDYEIIMALATPPSRDAFQRAEDQGVTALVNYPLFFSLGPGTSVDEKRAALEQFSESFIR